MFEGIEAVYATFVSYDEVAHHSGIDRPDVMKILRQLDDQIAFIAGAAKFSPRPYEFVILSDHGQSMGATFRQRYGQTLAELVDSLMGEGHHSVTPPTSSAEGIDYVSMILSELLAVGKERSSLLNRLLRKRIPAEGYVELRGQRKNVIRPDSLNGDKTMVCASGNLAHIYFIDYNESLTLDEIDAAFPRLTEGLCGHPGIGFVAVRTEKQGPIVIGKRGIYFLDTDKVDGENPLRDFGERAAQHVKTLISYPNSGDIIVNSLYIPETGEVAAFEELVGSHGGLGGTQNKPFILYPSALQDSNPPELIGAPSIYHLVKGWQRKMREQQSPYIPTSLPAPSPNRTAREHLRAIKLLAAIAILVGVTVLTLGLIGLVMTQMHSGNIPGSVNQYLVMILTAPFLIAVGDGLRRSQQWALNFAICINALVIMISAIEVLAEPPASRASLRGLPLVLLVYTVLFAALLYSKRIRRAFG